MSVVMDNSGSLGKSRLLLRSLNRSGKLNAEIARLSKVNSFSWRSLGLCTTFTERFRILAVSKNFEFRISNFEFRKTDSVYSFRKKNK